MTRADLTTDLTADDVIALLGLRPLPGEGGYYAETYRSAETASAGDLPAFGGPRSCGTAIYFLVTPDAFSALHRLVGDEVWHHYAGDSTELTLLHPDGRIETIRLGNDLRAGERPQAIVPGGVWQGCALAPGGQWALMGTTMSPGFDPRDFTLGDRTALLAAYPAAHDVIARLTRTGEEGRPG